MEDRPYGSIDDIIAEIAGKSIEELANEPFDGPRLISVDELRAAGALDVPPSWRKSLGGKQRDLFSDLVAGEERPKKPPSPTVDLDP